MAIYKYLPGSSVHGILQATVLEWGASAFSYGLCPRLLPGTLGNFPGCL